MKIFGSKLKIGLCTTLIKVQVLDTYGVIDSLAKQFDLDRSKGFKGKTKCHLFLDTATEHHTNASLFLKKI